LGELYPGIVQVVEAVGSGENLEVAIGSEDSPGVGYSMRNHC